MQNIIFSIDFRTDTGHEVIQAEYTVHVYLFKVYESQTYCDWIAVMLHFVKIF